MGKHVLILMFLAGMVWATNGCREKKKPSTKPSATAPAARTTPASRPADNESAVSVLTIDGQIVVFPQARLRLERRDGAGAALLFSDDPPNGVKEDYTQNFYYFDMPLDITDADQLPGAVWLHKAASAQRADSPNGIFLRGMKEHLQPDDVRVEFTRDAAGISAHLTGKFLWFRENAAQAHEHEPIVDGTLSLTLQLKRATSPR